jgi:hypothetical protein
MKHQVQRSAGFTIWLNPGPTAVEDVEVRLDAKALVPLATQADRQPAAAAVEPNARDPRLLASVGPILNEYPVALDPRVQVEDDNSAVARQTNSKPVALGVDRHARYTVLFKVEQRGQCR